jgi:hypothetical protein
MFMERNWYWHKLARGEMEKTRGKRRSRNQTGSGFYRRPQSSGEDFSADGADQRGLIQTHWIGISDHQRNPRRIPGSDF